MTIKYEWVIKHLNTDPRGYANSIHLEMEGSDSKNTVVMSAASAFGGEDYKPASRWSQEAIDAYAETHADDLKKFIAERLAELAE
jgi:hypothetical protein